MKIKRRSKAFTLTIADIGIALSVYDRKNEMVFSQDRDPFFAFIEDAPVDLSLAIHKTTCEKLPPFPLKNRIFTSGETWSLFEGGEGERLFFDTPYPEKSFDRAAILDADLRRGALYSTSSRGDHNEIYDPLGYPFDQLIMISLLGQGRGALVHACGVRYKDEGLLFVGKSGAGKTTMANLLRTDRDMKILNDDRIIIRQKEGRPVIYGTPWHGTGLFANPASAPLTNIFFLEHGKETMVRPLGRTEGTARLFAALFPTLWNKAGALFSLDLCVALSSNTPFHELRFVPDTTIVNFLKDAL